MADKGCGAGPLTTPPPEAGSYSLCSEQQWITFGCITPEAVDLSR